jgi:tetratricopeptide (TPR) repeat protein
LSVEPVKNSVDQLYSPAMLAELLQVSVRVVRRWHRAGLLETYKTVMQVPYFSYAEIARAKQLARWMTQGVTVQSLQHQLELIQRRVGKDTPVESLHIVADGKRLIAKHGDTTFEATGQLQFGFDASDLPEREFATLKFESANRKPGPTTPAAIARKTLEQMVNEAIEAEDAEDLETAIDWYRSALTAFGPNPDICFQLAELLYRQGDVHAARERYFMALELDPALVEAQANLGCVLAECGQLDLAIAAFEGALTQFEDYADVHFHLARALDETGQVAKALEHWKRFVDLAPASPWAEEAMERMSQSSAAWLDF